MYILMRVDAPIPRVSGRGFVEFPAAEPPPGPGPGYPCSRSARESAKTFHRDRDAGPRLRATCLSEELFAAAAMQAVRKDLMSMKVTELKEELEARGEPRTGNKAWLRRRLHAAIVRAHLEAVEEEDGM